MDIKRAGSEPSGKGSAKWFTGTVRIDPLFSVTAGAGRVQREGGRVGPIFPDDVVWFAPHEKHWHGAAPATAMSHIAIQEKQDGSHVDWLEHVTDAQYGA